MNSTSGTRAVSGIQTLVHKHFDAAIKQVDRVRREVSFVATHEVPDAVGEVVLVSGIDLRRYLANPTVLLQHDVFRPVARTTELVRKELNGFPALVGRAVFPEGDEDAEYTYGKIKAGLLTAVSIGFLSLEAGPAITPDQRSITHTRTELVELSFVTIPSCATCLITGKAARGRSTRDAQHVLTITDDEELVEVNENALNAILRETVKEAFTEITAEAVASAINAQRGRVD